METGRDIRETSQPHKAHNGSRRHYSVFSVPDVSKANYRYTQSHAVASPSDAAKGSPLAAVRRRDIRAVVTHFSRGPVSLELEMCAFDVCLRIADVAQPCRTPRITAVHVYSALRNYEGCS
ncbi:hypothetical protein MRX96_046716 [Rhipicephalus microplus]